MNKLFIQDSLIINDKYIIKYIYHQGWYISVGSISKTATIYVFEIYNIPKSNMII